MTFFNSMRASGVDPLVVSGGDFLFSMKDYNQKNAFYRRQMQTKARLIIDAYNRFGYDVAAVGECELIYGLDTLLELQKEMKFPLVCSNLVREADESLVFPASTILEKNGRKVGVIGAIMETLSPQFQQRCMPGLKVTPALDAIAAEVEKLRDKVDVIFALAHLNRDNVDRIAAQVPGIDFILEPNSYIGNAVIWIADDKRFIEKNGTLLLKTDGQGSHLGRLDIDLSEGPGKPWSSSADPQPGSNVYTGHDIALGPHWGHHAGMKKQIAAYKRNSQKFTPSTEEYTFQASEDYLTVDTCGTCHPEQLDFWKKTTHAKAYETLVKTDDQHRYDCLPCHVVGYGETFIDSHKVDKYKDVQCESCHGTNPRHPTDPVRFKWPTVTDVKCWGCHNPVETKVDFKPDEAIPKIACPKMDRG